MRTILPQIILAAFLLVMLTGAGCVAPPEGSTSTSTGPVDLYDPNKFSSVSPGQTQNILESATPFQTLTTTKPGYNVMETIKVIPEDQVCLFEFTKMNMTLEMNKTARKFNLINPPMYINYSISKPYNVTGTKIITKNAGKEEKITYSYYNPYAYFEIIVRDPTTGTILFQDGFGKDYSSKLNRTIQITKSGNLLIEISGFNVTPSVGFWIKPSGNLDPALVNLSSLDCRTQDYVKRMNQ